VSLILESLPATRVENGLVKAPQHDELGVSTCRLFLERLRVNTIDGYRVRDQAIALVAHHLLPLRFFRNREYPAISGDGAFRRLALKVEMDLLYRVARADCLGRKGEHSAEAEEWFRRRVRELGIEETGPAPILLGRHVLALGLEPGPSVGQLTRAVYEMQLDGVVTTLEEAITEAKRQIGK
jgi:tRNA nucleotidyltransferase (CCA-adding enzyme)